MSEKSLDARARRAARRIGLVARKSRWRLDTIDNRGGYMLHRADPQHSRGRIQIRSVGGVCHRIL